MLLPKADVGHNHDWPNAYLSIWIQQMCGREWSGGRCVPIKVLKGHWRPRDDLNLHDLT